MPPSGTIQVLGLVDEDHVVCRVGGHTQPECGAVEYLVLGTTDLLFFWWWSLPLIDRGTVGQHGGHKGLHERLWVHRLL